MTSEEQFFLVQFAACLREAQRLRMYEPITPEEIEQYTRTEPEGSVFVVFSHQLAMQAARSLLDIAINDRSSQGIPDDHSADITAAA